MRDAEAAYKNFFASLKGTRKGAKMGVPRFKSFGPEHRWLLPLPAAFAAPQIVQGCAAPLGCRS
ncbi:hypothetical protein ACWF76_07765 [Streptomyces globisporus]